MPLTLEDLYIPKNLLEYGNNEYIKHWDNGPNEENRILMFSTKITSEWMCKDGGVLLADGTFSVIPQLFLPNGQLYTLHVWREGISVPCLFVLSNNRKEDTYLIILNQLKIDHPTFYPRIILTDFERSSINAFQIAFPLAKQHGCFFHFAQTVWRKVFI